MNVAAPRRRRGQPLVVLALLLGGWTATRVVLWEPPFATQPETDRARAVRLASVATASRTAANAPPPTATYRPMLGETRREGSPGLAILRSGRHDSLPPMLTTARTTDPAAAAPHPLTPVLSPGSAGGHQPMMMAALGRLQLPPLNAARSPQPAPPLENLPPLALSGVSRWSGDGWALVRRGTGDVASAAAPVSYGASQAGAVLRYDLAPGSALGPRAYARVSRALGGFDEGEVAFGVSARPLARLPVRLLAEGRVQRAADRTRLRPAASLLTELAPQPLPLGAEGEVYAQAGYVGGRGATPFFDLAATATRSLATAGPAELRLGAGAWAGGQDGASRLDLGPRASVRLQVGGAVARVALDWRFRVAGNAAPASGPALTFSAGF